MFAAALVFLIAGESAFAQREQSPARRLPILHSIADAEAEGATFPRGEKPEHVASTFAGTYPGTVERKCVEGPNTGYGPMQLRSGEFVIGGQIGGSAHPIAGRGSKIWWAPYHNPHDYATSLVVRGARLGNPGDTIRFAPTGYAWSAGMPKTESFFPSGLGLTHPGKWLLIATAGDDWGCFILTAI